jgi:hypothetical protein
MLMVAFKTNKSSRVHGVVLLLSVVMPLVEVLS